LRTCAYDLEELTYFHKLPDSVFRYNLWCGVYKTVNLCKQSQVNGGDVQFVCNCNIVCLSKLMLCILSYRRCCLRRGFWSQTSYFDTVCKLQQHLL